MAADLVGRRIVCARSRARRGAVARRRRRPFIVFAIGSDPVETGLVVSLNRPGGNVTGASLPGCQLGCEATGIAARTRSQNRPRWGLLANPNNPGYRPRSRGCRRPRHVLGLQLNVLRAAYQSDFDNVFAVLVRAADRCGHRQRRSILPQSSGLAGRASFASFAAHDLLCA